MEEAFRLPDFRCTRWRMYGIRIEKVLLCDEERRTIMNLTGRDFLKLLDFTSAEIGYMLDLAADLKEKKKRQTTVKTSWMR